MVKRRSEKRYQVGNYFVDVASVHIGHGERIDAVLVTDNEKLWSVQIPQTWNAFYVIKELLETGQKKDLDIVHTLLTNMQCVCSIMDGKFQGEVAMAGVGYLDRVSKEKPVYDEKYETFANTKAELDAEIEDAESMAL